MDWVDYREQLGIGLSDEDKHFHLVANVFSMLSNLEGSVTSDAYLSYCFETGTRAYLDTYKTNYYDYIVKDLSTHQKNIKDFLSHYVVFAKIQADDCKKKKIHSEDYLRFLKDQLDAIHISYEIIEDKDGQFIFPKGVDQFDKELVSKVLTWLCDYPETQKAWKKALLKYADAEKDNASDVADAFRKALERLFQEVFDSNKSLENYKSDYGDFLDSHGVPKEISNNLTKLLVLYTDFNNSYAKHHDKTELKVLEYIMYQTGNIMRLMIMLDKEKDGK